MKELPELYLNVIFSKVLHTYKRLVVDRIGLDGIISDRLYRQHTMNVGNINIKELDKLGRDIKHIILIDYFIENYSLYPINGSKL